MDAVSSDRAYRLAKSCCCIGRERALLYEALKDFREVEIYRRDDPKERAENLLYQLRREEGCSWLFVCHANPKTQHISQREQYVIRVKGCFTAAVYDTLTGEIRRAETYTDQKSTFIRCDLYGEDSVLYQLRKRAKADGAVDCEEIRNLPYGGAAAPMPQEKGDGAVRLQTVHRLRKISCFKRQEPNVLLLDYAAYRLDDGALCEREEILRLDNKLRSELGFAVRRERMSQPYHLKERETHKVTLYYHIQSRAAVGAMLAIEEPDSCRIWLNGEEADRRLLGYYVDPSISVVALPNLREGENELKVQVAYHQKTNLENLYLLGDFDVEVNGSSTVIAPARSSLSLGDITRQGMPFYTGNLEYTFFFEAQKEDTEYYVHIPHFKAPLLAVFVDGEKKGLIVWAPHRQKLGRLSKGLHRLTICLYGNRFNGFGTLHNANEKFVWYGPDSFRTAGDDWTEEYLVRKVGILSAVEIEI